MNESKLIGIHRLQNDGFDVTWLDPSGSICHSIVKDLKELYTWLVQRIDLS